MPRNSNSGGWTGGPHSVVSVDHLGDPAWAVRAADGDLIAVGCLKADAQLFAAAPDLAEAAETALEALLGMQRVLAGQGLMVGCENPAIPALRAALSKALGQ